MVQQLYWLIFLAN